MGAQVPQGPLEEVGHAQAAVVAAPPTRCDSQNSELEVTSSKPVGQNGPPFPSPAAEDADVLTSSEETSMQLQSNIGEEATSKKKKKGSGSDSSSRANPQMYLLLENLVWRHRRPCVLDLKVHT